MSMMQEIVAALHDIAYQMAPNYEQQQLLDELRKANLDILDVQRQIHYELSGIDGQLSRIVDALERLVSHPEQLKEKPKQREMIWSTKSKI